MDCIANFFADNFQNCIWLAVILISICPTLESKIAVPLAMNSAIWGNNAFSPMLAFLIAFVASILPSYLIMITTRKIKTRTSLLLHSKFIQKYAIKGAKIENNHIFKKYLALCSFVALPLPLTGVWSGSLIAGLSNLNLHYSFLSICIGAFISTALITLLCSVFSNSISAIFMLSIAIIIIVMIIDLGIQIYKSTKKSDI